MTDTVPAAAITALPWEDPAERGPAHPDWAATCDWGACDGLSVTMRWDDRLKQWLAACADHAPDRDARCAALPPDHELWECE